MESRRNPEGNIWEMCFICAYLTSYRFTNLRSVNVAFDIELSDKFNRKNLISFNKAIYRNVFEWAFSVHRLWRLFCYLIIIYNGRKKSVFSLYFRNEYIFPFYYYIKICFWFEYAPKLERFWWLFSSDLFLTSQENNHNVSQLSIARIK